MFRPWRNAFLADLARPRADLGPVLARALARLVAALRSRRIFSVARRRLDQREFAFKWAASGLPALAITRECKQVPQLRGLAAVETLDDAHLKIQLCRQE